MTTVENTQMHFGEIAIAQIEIDSKSRDDIPAVLKGLHRIGLLLQRRARERIRRQKKVRLRAALRSRYRNRQPPGRSRSDGNGCLCLFGKESHSNW